MRRPRRGSAAVSTSSEPVTRNAPTVVGQLSSAAPVETRIAAPGVDHASVSGARCRKVSQIVPVPTSAHRKMSPVVA